MSFLKSEVNDFIDFLADNNIIQIGTSFIVSQQVSNLFTEFINTIVGPIIHKITGSEEKSIEDVTVDLFGAELKIGKFSMALTKLLLTFIIMFYILKLLQAREMLRKNK